MILLSVLGLLGLVSIAIALIVLGLLSKRLGETTRAPRRYLHFYVAAALLLISAATQTANLLLNLMNVDELSGSFLWVLLYNGLPALGITLGLMAAWHYWSWLLAERD